MKTKNSTLAKVFLIALAGIVCIAAVMFFVNMNNDPKEQKAQVERFFELFCSGQEAQMFGQFRDGSDEAAFDALFTEKFEAVLTKKCFDSLISNRILSEPEQIAGDTGCYLSYNAVALDNEAKTVDGYPSYTFSVTLNTAFPDGSSKQLVQNGTVNFVKSNGKWLIDYLAFQKGSRLSELFQN